VGLEISSFGNTPTDLERLRTSLSNFLRQRAVPSPGGIKSGPSR
jgi:hypothetical protein